MSNDLRYSITKATKDGGKIKIKIRLNDECKNGHQDFSITADGYEKDGRGRLVWSYGGRCHDDILAAAPEFQIFVNLHNCDYTGVPVYVSANGFYHLRNGFNAEKIGTPEFKIKFCEYYRVTEDQFEALDTAETELQFKIMLDRLGILSQWRKEANEAIAILETLTGQTFTVDSIRSNYIPATETEIAAENERIETGYYTPEAREKREAARIEAARIEALANLEKERDQTIAKANANFAVMSEVLRIGGPDALKNCIYYDHSKTLAFNWMTYGAQIPEIEVNRIISEMQLPDGVTAKMADRK